MKRGIYISGKISGTADFLERFRTREEGLRAAGWSVVVNPTTIHAGPKSWLGYMAADLAALAGCAYISLPARWWRLRSKGVWVEVVFALLRGITFIIDKN